VSTIRTGLTTGTRAIISRSIGAGDKESANNVANQSFVVSLIFAIVSALIGLFWSRQMLSAIGLQPDALAAGTAYLQIQLVGMVTTSFQMLSQSLMQSAGDSKTPMNISLVTRIFHLVLSPFLIFGWWIFPRMGVSGSALTGVLSQGIAGVWGMWLLYTGRSRIQLTVKHFRFDWPMIWRITKIGIPASLMGAERSSATLLVTLFIVPFGTLAVAAHTVMERIDGFIRMPAMAMGQGAGVLAGQNLGANQPERAEKTGWLAAGIFTGFLILVSIAIWFQPEFLIRIFNNQPELVEIGVVFLKIQLINFVVGATTLVLMGCLNGVGDTWIPMLNTMITLWGVQMPLAFVLSRYTSLGVYGVRWAMAIAIVVRAAIYAIYFKTGRWKKIKI
jgi:putative MATE family efflux protein